MKIQAKGSSVTVTFSTIDAQALAEILSFARDVNDPRAVRMVQKLAAVAEHLDGDVQTFCLGGPQYEATRRFLDARYGA